MPQLVAAVHVYDAKGVVHVFGPGGIVPEWAVKLIPNAKAWDSKPSVVAAVPVVEVAPVVETTPTKPFSQMNKTELEQIASDEGVDLTGLNKNDEIRAAIKAARK